MTHTFKLARRAARFRPMAAAFALLIAGACDSSDSLGPANTDGTPLEEQGDSTAGSPVDTITVAIGDSTAGVADTVTDAELEAAEALGDVAFASGSSAKGIAFGPYNLPNSMMGSQYTGSVKAVGPGDVLGTLAAVRRAGGRVLIRLSAGDRYWLNRNHTVNLDKWKSQVARFKRVNIQPYINDGTIIGHMLIDEPHDASNWGGKPVPFATLEAMARYSKQLWPGMTTVVRSYSTWLTKASFRWKYLDATLAQYTASKGEVSRWLSNEARAAKSEGLGLMVGMNLLNGGNKASGIRGLYRGMYAISAGQLKSWGTLLATHPQSCAWLSWNYSSSYLGRSDIRSAMSYVASKAKNRGRQSCRA
jgi:hypothetical protein